MEIAGIEHMVLMVENLERTCEFYRRVFEMRVVELDHGRKALQFGDQKINLHQRGQEPEPRAARPTAGSADFCLITATSIDQVIQHLATCGVTPVAGPVRRSGALGPMSSVYVRDPDGNLVEIACYEEIIEAADSWLP